MILEREKWKIASDLTLYLSGNNLAYLVNTEGMKKRDILLLKREIGDSREISINETNGFKLRLRPDLRFEIWWDGIWRLVQNQIGTDYSGFILTQVGSKKGGELEGIFEAIICPSYYPGKVFFVSQEMKEYDSCFNEMARVINCSLFKKTRKWKPGHRYDSDKKTYFYLGEFMINQEEDNSAYMYSDPPRFVHLVSKNIRGCKTVSDVLFSQPLSYGGLIALDKLPLMVDSGECLKDDISDKDMKDLRLPLFEKYLSDGRRPDEILSCLSYSIQDVEDKIKNYIISIYKEELHKVLLTYWKSNSFTDLGNREEGEDIKEAIRLTCKQINPYNIYSNLYYYDLFKKIGIDLTSITKEAIENFSFKKSMFTNFEDYVSFCKLYFKYHDNTLSERTINQRSKSIYLGYGEKKSKISKISDILIGNYLSQEIINIIGEVLTDTSFDVTYFQNIKNNPSDFVRVKITLEDIIRHRKGIDNIPNNLKREIMDNKFQNVIIEFDKDAKIV